MVPGTRDGPSARISSRLGTSTPASGHGGNTWCRSPPSNANIKFASKARTWPAAAHRDTRRLCKPDALVIHAVITWTITRLGIS